MSCEYCPPKSSTRIIGACARRSTAFPYSLLPTPHSPMAAKRSSPHSDALGALLGLALGRERGRVHDLGLLELFDVLVARRRHARPQGAHEVERPVVLPRRSHEYLFRRTGGPRTDARAAREGGVEGGHPPRVTASGSLFCSGESAAQHYGVGPTGYGLGDLTSCAHPAVGDDVHVLARLQVVAHAGGGGVGHGRGLRHADPDHSSRGTDTPRSDADEDADGPRPHEVERRGVARAAADYHGDVQGGHELHEVQRFDGPRDVLGGDHGPLDDEDVQASLYGRSVVTLDTLGRERGRRYDAFVLYLLHAPEDELFFDGLGVDILHDPCCLVLGQARYLLEYGTRILVPGLQSLEVQHGETAQRTDDARRRGVDGRIQGAGQAGQIEGQVAQSPGDVHVFGVAGPAARYYGDLVEPVGPARGLASPYLNIHVSSGVPFRSFWADETGPTEDHLRGPRYTFLPDFAIGLMLHP